MRKIHVLFKKEELDQERSLKDKVIVVFDILLATTTITAILESGAKAVIPVLHGKEGKEEAENHEDGSFLLVGEHQGVTIDDFHSPLPIGLMEKVQGKTVILSTTNGTVAIWNASEAKQVYAASLLNSAAVAKQILENYKNETILLVCAGSSGSFNMEDFYGAGYFVECLLTHSAGPLERTDAACAAHRFYQGNASVGEDILKQSRVGKKLQQYGHEKDISYAARRDLYSIVPSVKDGKYVVINQISETGDSQK